MHALGIQTRNLFCARGVVRAISHGGEKQVVRAYNV